MLVKKLIINDSILLNLTKTEQGFISNHDGSVVLTWALGHLLELQMPHEYKKEWGYFSIDYFPMIPEKTPIDSSSFLGSSLEASR